MRGLIWKCKYFLLQFFPLVKRIMAVRCVWQVDGYCNRPLLKKNSSEDVLLQHHRTRRTDKNKHESINQCIPHHVILPAQVTDTDWS